MQDGFSWYPAPRYLLRKKLIIRELKKQKCKGAKILEIGYGSGDMLCTYAKMGMVVFGYDFSSLAKEEAEKRIHANGLDDKIILFDSEKEAFSYKYDIFAACEVLEHIRDDIGVLKLWANLLIQNGEIIISVPSRMKKWCLNDEWAGHYRRYEKKELKKMFLDAGIQIDEILSYPFPINVVLDRLLNYKKKKEIIIQQNKKMSKEDSTKESGIKRNTGNLARILSREWVLYPWYMLQLMFLKTDLGSGYIIVGHKKM